MYPLRPPKVYVDATIDQDKRWADRAAALLHAMGDPPVETLSGASVPEIVRAHDWTQIPERANQCREGEEPIVVLNTLRFDGDKSEAGRVLERCPAGTSRQLVERLLGVWSYDHWSPSIRSGEQVCRRGYEWNPIWGCPHYCLYCPYGGLRVMTVALNVEELIERQIRPAMAANPHLTVWRYEMASSDALSIEPEYDATRAYIEHFAADADNCFLIHTKSANVDYLLDLDHNGHTIMVWSLTSHSVSRQVERFSGTTEERIEAARKCQQAGYPVRFKFKPIVPVRRWRDECRDMIDQALATVRPESLGLCTLMWIKAADLDRVYGADLLDPAFVAAAHEHAGDMADHPVGPFPDDVRAEIYEFFIDEIRQRDADIPVYLCAETLAMWKRLGAKLGCGPRDYVCGCGSRCTPGTLVLDPPEVLAGPKA